MFKLRLITLPDAAKNAAAKTLFVPFFATADRFEMKFTRNHATVLKSSSISAKTVI